MLAYKKKGAEDMNKSIVKIIFVVSILACGSLRLVMAQEEASSAVEKEATDLENAPIESFPEDTRGAIEVYIAHATAEIEEDYQKSWDLCCPSYQQGAWDSFEEYKEAKLKRPGSYHKFRRIVEEAKSISPTEVHLKVGSEQTFVMSKEDGRWCRKGNLADLLAGNFDGEEKR